MCVCDPGFSGDGLTCMATTTDAGPPDAGLRDAGSAPDAGTCTAETDIEFCAAAGWSCGTLSALDNCGTARTADCGSCGANASCNTTSWSCVCDPGFTGDGQTCSAIDAGPGDAGAADAGAADAGAPDAGGCAPESDMAFCQSAGYACGILTTFDNCGSVRTADCGSCGANASCNSLTWSCACNPGFTGDGMTCSAIDAGMPDAGPTDAGACMPESDAVLCQEAGDTCGTPTLVDSCGSMRMPSCGTCGANASCDTAFTCACDPGFSGDGVTCTVIDAGSPDAGPTDAGPEDAGPPDAGPCVSESSTELCLAANRACGIYSTIDNCGLARSVNCGSCGSNATCDPSTFTCACESGFTGDGYTCTCEPESDSDLCTAWAATCGTPALVDNCGNTRTPACGTCGSNASCNASSSCGCDPGFTGDGYTCTGIQPWPQLTPGNGDIVPTVSLVTVTFTGYAYAQQAQDFGAFILGSNYWAQAGAEYGLNGGLSAGQQIATPVLNPTQLWTSGVTDVTTSQATTFLDAQIAAGNLTVPDTSGATVYLVYIPSGFSVNGTCGGPFAFHAYETYTPSGGNAIPYEVAFIADCGHGFDRITVEASHQLFQCATDPSASMGWRFRVPGYEQWQLLWDENNAEAGGFCQNLITTITNGATTYTVQRLWSNNAAMTPGSDPCLPASSSDVYRNVSPDAPVKTAVPGATVTFTLTGWSNVGTADWPITAYDSYQAEFSSNPTLSAGTIGDNTTVTLTLTVPSDAIPGQFGGAVIWSGDDSDPLCFPGSAPCVYWEVGLQVVSPPSGGSFDAGPDFDTAIMTDMQNGDIPGMAIALVKGNQVLMTAGYGLADIDGGVPVTQDTLFQLASVSKTVTATALMQLQEQGYFSLDDDVNGPLSWTVQSPYFPSSPVTYREVLTHTSTIHDGPQIDNKVVSGDSPIPLDTFMDGYLTPGGAYYGSGFHWSHSYAPGTHYDYSNGGAGLAGDLVEQISGENLQQYCQANIFTPLGMTNTSWFLADLNQSQIAVPYAIQSDGSLAPGPYLGWPTYPDGQLRTSSAQLAQFLLAFINQGTYGGATIVQPATASEMMTEQVGGQGEGLFWEYLWIGDYLLIGHGGLYTGMSTMMYFDPMTGAGYVCLINSDIGGVSSGPAADAFNDIQTRLITAAEQAP
jgi:CubicO group peptidase (beta-lactamase class C family)